MVDGRDRDGDEFYIEHQGICLDEATAYRMADKALWGFHKLPLNESLSKRTTIAVNHQMPASEASERYRRNGKSTMPVARLDLERLAAKLAQSDALIERYNSTKV